MDRLVPIQLLHYRLSLLDSLKVSALVGFGAEAAVADFSFFFKKLFLRLLLLVEQAFFY